MFLFCVKMSNKNYNKTGNHENKLTLFMNYDCINEIKYTIKQ